MVGRREFLIGAASLCGALYADRQALGQAKPSPAADNPYAEIFDTWVAQHRPATALMLIRRGGRDFVHTHNTDAARPTLIASMSKAITGAAIATLVRDGKLAFATPMREALAGYFRQYGPHSDARFADVTIEQLLVHRSGLAGNPDGDPIHRIRQRRGMQGLGHQASPQPLMAEQFAATPLRRPPGGEMVYSNTGYLTLSAIIEERSGKPYETYCREAVLRPLGLDARLHPDWAMSSGSGGWTITASNYLRLLEIFQASHSFLGDTAKAWIDAMRTKYSPENRGGWYSLGVFTAAGRGRWSVNHGGLLNSHIRDRAGRPVAIVVKSHAERRADGTAAFFAITPNLANEAFGELRRAIAEAHAAVKA